MEIHDFKQYKKSSPLLHPISNNSSLVLTLLKWGETSCTTNLLLIHTSSTSGLRNDSGTIPYSLVVAVFFAQMRSDSGIIPESLQRGRVIIVVTSPD